ncbi:hypothetical protein AB0F30_19015 [Streptomyces sp. NPDC029006]|uniref:nSTAND1 domain-containing NTPase n=1 Tax=Streptomyces sp. NPDC029006 TaxID=3155467 RepID=UPI0033CBECCC
MDVTLSYVRACGGDPREWEGRWHAVAVELRAVSSAGAPGERDGAGQVGGAHAQPCPEVPAGPPRGPYVGLAAFRTEDADLFFGRERLVEGLLVTLARRRAVAVAGASGAGKSSLLRAGLLPRLTRDEPRRRVRVLTPGPHPRERLERALAAGRESGEPGLGCGPGPEPGSEPGELVIVVDQFEEVFTVCTDADERARFIAALVEEAERPGSGCRIVLGVRADFYAHCTRHAPLVAILRDAQVVVGPMSAAELRCAVVEPARRAGLTVEGALQATLVAHAHGQAGVLPLLSHALLETWRRRRGAALTLDGLHAGERTAVRAVGDGAYVSSGGVQPGRPHTRQRR